MANKTLIKKWSADAAKTLVGRTIVAAAYVPDNNWGTALEVTLNDGSKFYPSSDDEGNEAGALQCVGPAPDHPATLLPRIR